MNKIDIMKRLESIDLEGKVFQLTLTGEQKGDYVWETRDVVEIEKTRRKEGLFGKEKEFSREVEVKKTAWFKKDSYSSFDDTISLLARLNAHYSGDGYQNGTPYYVKDNTLIRRPEVKFILMGTDGEKGVRTLNYKFYFDTFDDAKNMYDIVLSKNPHLIQILDDEVEQ